MKKLLYLLPLFILAYSCQKSITSGEIPEPNTENTGQLYNVAFNVSDFEVETTDMNLQSASLDGADSTGDNYLKYLHCEIFYNPDYYSSDKAGRRVTQMEQHFGEGNFGNFSVALSKGYYTIVLVGAHGAERTPVGVSFSPEPFWVGIEFYSPQSDIFAKKFNLTISDKDTLLDQIQLNRLSGKLEIHFTDSIPGYVTEIKAMVKGIAYWYDIVKDVPQIYSDMERGFSAVRPDFGNLEGFYCGSDGKLQVTIEAIGGQFTYLKTIDDVYIYPNKKTILTGPFSSIVDSTGVGIKPVADTAFDQTITTYF